MGHVSLKRLFARSVTRLVTQEERSNLTVVRITLPGGGRSPRSFVKRLPPTTWGTNVTHALLAALATGASCLHGGHGRWHLTHPQTLPPQLVSSSTVSAAVEERSGA